MQRHQPITDARRHATSHGDCAGGFVPVGCSGEAICWGCLQPVTGDRNRVAAADRSVAHGRATGDLHPCGR